MELDGERLLVSPNVTSEQMELAAEHFRARREGRGPAKQMVDFLQPLLDDTDGSPEQMNRVMQLGMLWWNLATLPPGEREDLLTEMVNKVSEEDEVRQEFRRVAVAMVERHRAMFPRLHAT